jgi:hypothetical protein
MAMRVTHEIRAFDYEIADEVVVRLDHVEVFDVTSSIAVRAGCLPGWTIADVTARLERDERHLYAIRFHHDDAVCIALVGEEAIDGTA